METCTSAPIAVKAGYVVGEGASRRTVSFLKSSSPSLLKKGCRLGEKRGSSAVALVVNLLLVASSSCVPGDGPKGRGCAV